MISAIYWRNLFMGRYYWDKKDTTEESKSISITFLKKHGYLDFGYRSGTVTYSRGETKTGSIGISVITEDDIKYIQFNYTITDRDTGDKKEYDYKVPLVTTPCNYGGVRYWFICPLTKEGVFCGRRVGVLYLSPGASYFGCRHCYNLTYESRNESRRGIFGVFNIYFKADKIKERMKRTFYNGKPTKKMRRYMTLKMRLPSKEEFEKMTK